MLGVILRLIVLGSALGSGFTWADPIADIYQVEVIVFEHTDPKRFSAEKWPKLVGEIDYARAVNLDTLRTNIPDSIDTLDVLDALDDAGENNLNDVIKGTINIVDQQHYLLKNEIQKIRTSKSERFIKHMAWNQPLANNVKSTPVYFTVGKDQDIIALINIKPTRNVFNVSLDVIYKVPVHDRKHNPEINAIRLVKEARVKKKEIYYVDHPVLGIIILVSPVVYGTNSYAPLPNM